MEFDKKQTKSILRIVFLSILFYFFLKEFGLVVSGLGYLWEVFGVFAIGGAMAFIINVPMTFFENRYLSKFKHIDKAKRPLAFVFTLLTVTVVIYLVIFIVVPQLAQTLQTVIAELQAFYGRLPQIVADLAARFNLTEETVQSLQIEWSQISQAAIKAAQSLATGIISSSTNVISGVVNAITQFILAFIFCIYILFSKEKLGRACKKLIYALFKEKHADDIISVLHMTNRTFTSFLSGQCLEAVILGALFIVAMTVFRMPYALLVGVLIMVTALVPIVGAFVGCIVGAFLILVVNPVQALWFVIMFLVIQQIEGNIIYPKVVGSSVGLPAILVFAAVIVGGELFGVVGMLVFIPLTSVCFTIAKAVVELRLNKKNIPSEKLK
ncbi:MAG: AI-2E family transporter [Oscillospiraceae bacterium]|nr:AI-2E family transporter [Oscillospiraceae bacterium]